MTDLAPAERLPWLMETSETAAKAQVGPSMPATSMPGRLLQMSVRFKLQGGSP